MSPTEKTAAWGLLPWLTLFAVVASAHHSTAYFSEDIIELEGEIVDVRWSNPHVGLTVSRVNAQGVEERWSLISNSLYNLQRAGVTRDLMRVGQRVKIAVRPSTLEEQVGIAENMLLADGREVVLRRDARPLWSENPIGGRSHWLSAAGLAVAPAGEKSGIFRVWSASEVRAAKVRNPYTDAAYAAQAAWNTLDNFMTRCEAPGMPYLMTSPHPHEFVDRGDVIELRVAWFDQVRSIHVAGSAAANEPAASRVGHSVGRWEADTLVVETDGIDWPYVDRIGTPQSDAVKVIERFTLSEDQGGLRYHMTITDSLAFTEPATYETTWVALGEKVEPYNCEAL